MASRKEQKEKLRRERERREAEAKAAERRKRMIGYGVGGAIVAAAAVVLLVLVLAGGGDGASGDSGLYPGGGSVPDQKVTDLSEAAKAAGCELKSVQAKSREHTGDLAEKIQYSTNPPTSGKHYEVPANDEAFTTAPDVKELVHTMEHGRVIIWFRKNLPARDRADLKTLYDEDPYQMVLAPNETGMKYAVAATAWNSEPVPNGTGRLLGCPKFTSDIYDALRTFKDEHRSNGPEAVP